MAPNKKMLVKAISTWKESNRPGFHSDALQVDDGSKKVVARTEELVEPSFAAEQQEKEYTRNIKNLGDAEIASDMEYILSEDLCDMESSCVWCKAMPERRLRNWR